MYSFIGHYSGFESAYPKDLARPPNLESSEETEQIKKYYK